MPNARRKFVVVSFFPQFFIFFNSNLKLFIISLSHWVHKKDEKKNSQTLFFFPNWIFQLLFFFLSYFHLFCWARARVRHLRIVWSEKSDWRVFNSAAAEPPVRENEVEVNFLLRWALSWARAKMLQPSKRAVKKQKQKKKALNVFLLLFFHSTAAENLFGSPPKMDEKKTPSNFKHLIFSHFARRLLFVRLQLPRHRSSSICVCANC